MTTPEEMRAERQPFLPKQHSLNSDVDFPIDGHGNERGRQEEERNANLTLSTESRLFTSHSTTQNDGDQESCCENPDVERLIKKPMDMTFDKPL